MLRFILIILSGAIILMGFSIYNGYPILYPDTSTYLASGFELESPSDRPITYGLFIRAFSAGTSLWLIALIQCLITSTLIMAFVRLVFGEKVIPKFAVIISVLGGLTVLPFVAGQIITDIFPGIALLCLTLLLFQKMAKGWIIALCLGYFLSISMHMSHVLIFGSLLFGLLMFNRRISRLNIQMNLGMVIAMLFLTVASIATMGSAVAKSKHVFFMGRMAENGILKSYLEEHCQENTFKLCCCVDDLPENTTDFLWDPESPLYSQFDSWADSIDEFSSIINGTFSSPKYLGMHAKEGVKNSTKQLITFKAGDGYGPVSDNELLYERLHEYVPEDIEFIDSSKQSKGKLLPSSLARINGLYTVVIILALIILIAGFTIKSLRTQWSNAFRLVIVIFTLTYVINCIVNASLVIVADRFGAKLIWIFPLLATIAIIQWTSGRKNAILR